MDQAPALPPVTAPRTRLPGIDMARGIALIGMAIFHFTVDLEMVGAIAPGTVLQPFWMIFARTVAGSFVFLAGVSLVLASHDGLRWRSFLRGTGLVALAALAVTAATLVAVPQAWVFFGILHLIAVARLLGLAFLRAPVWLLVAAGVAVWALPYLIGSPAFSPRALAWIGFARPQPLSMDLEPVFPWFGPFLLGMAAARLGLAQAMPRPRQPGRLAAGLAFAGRHSLAIYLIHQPLLIGLVWLIFA